MLASASFLASNSTFGDTGFGMMGSALSFVQPPHPVIIFGSDSFKEGGEAPPRRNHFKYDYGVKRAATKDRADPIMPKPVSPKVELEKPSWPRPT